MPQPTPYNTPTIINNAPNITASHYMAHIGSRKVLWWNARAGYMHKCIFVDVGWVGGGVLREPQNDKRIAPKNQHICKQTINHFSSFFSSSSLRM